MCGFPFFPCPFWGFVKGQARQWEIFFLSSGSFHESPVPLFHSGFNAQAMSNHMYMHISHPHRPVCCLDLAVCFS